MAKVIMVQGTASNVGKSILVTALCRVLRQDGYRVVPFKAQNMALNSFVTEDGGEMGTAQVLQARAAGLKPVVEMNPILLKPTANASSQVIVLGRSIGEMKALDYRGGKDHDLLSVVECALARLHQDFDVIVIEGAGSPVEVNLKDRDLANMRVARLAQAPVLLVADIDRGGALAAVVGTLDLLDPDERDLVKGIVINKFRGDISLLQPALDFLENKTGKPVLGVLPHIDLHLPAEDSLCLADLQTEQDGGVEIAILSLPHISNFTDFDPLALEPGVRVRYVKDGEPLGRPDMIILPDTKNPIEDLHYLNESGYAAAVRRAAREGSPVCGIGGGFQMMGKELRELEHPGSPRKSFPGLGILDAVTVFDSVEVQAQAEGEICGESPLFGRMMAGQKVTGYVLHMGHTKLGPGARPLLQILNNQESETGWDGAVDSTGLIWGTYLHGIFDNDRIRRGILEYFRRRRGLDDSSENHLDRQDQLERELDRLADICRSYLDMESFYEILGLPSKVALNKNIF
jgi:adenosylcobyric acid synthase